MRRQSNQTTSAKSANKLYVQARESSKTKAYMELWLVDEIAAKRREMRMFLLLH